MSEPLKLTPKVKSKEEHRKDIENILGGALKEVEAGDIDCVLIITRKLDGFWNWSLGGDRWTAEMVGRLEIVKHEIIAEFLRDIT